MRFYVKKHFKIKNRIKNEEAMFNFIVKIVKQKIGLVGGQIVPYGGNAT